MHCFGVIATEWNRHVCYFPVILSRTAQTYPEFNTIWKRFVFLFNVTLWKTPHPHPTTPTSSIASNQLGLIHDQTAEASYTSIWAESPTCNCYPRTRFKPRTRAPWNPTTLSKTTEYPTKINKPTKRQNRNTQENQKPNQTIKTQHKENNTE